MEGDLQRVLGLNFRLHRQARQLSQEAFADVIGLHRTYLGAVERGEKNVSLRWLERYAERLGVPPLDLLEAPASAEAVPQRRRATAKKQKRSRGG